jgi:TolB-like protein/Flp pilus assembly protein TadD
MEFRIGIHLGEVLVEGERLFGTGVNVAARLQALAEPAGLCISNAIREQLGSTLALDYVDMGEQLVKNIPEPVHAYGISQELPAAAAPAPRSRRTGVLIASAAAIVAVALLGVWRLTAQDSNRAAADGTASPIRSIAVLPLENLSGDPGQQYFADAMTEELISTLARIGSLRVISRTSVMQFKEARRPLPEIAQILNVDAILEGSVLRAGDSVRITAQLIDARTDYHIWARDYERELRDVIALQNDVAEAVAQGIAHELSPEEAAQFANPRTVDPEAYEAYLRGRFFQRAMTPLATLKSVEYFDEAISIAPGFAQGYAGLADPYSCAPLHPWSAPVSPDWPSRPEDLIGRAREAALKAVELDDKVAEGHTSLGLSRFFLEWDWAGAERAYLRSLELNPSNSFNLEVYALLLTVQGRLGEAIDAFQRSIELDPLIVNSVVFLGDAHAWNDNTAEAMALWQHAIELDPRYPTAHQSLGRSLCGSGQADEGIRVLERARSLSPNDPLIAADMGHCYARSGRRDEARQLLFELESRGSDGAYVSPVSLALIHLGLDELEASLAWLERAYDARAFWLTQIVLDQRYDRLRSDPRFQDLVRRIGLPDRRSEQAIDVAARS